MYVLHESLFVSVLTSGHPSLVSLVERVKEEGEWGRIARLLVLTRAQWGAMPDPAGRAQHPKLRDKFG